MTYFLKSIFSLFILATSPNILQAQVDENEYLNSKEIFAKGFEHYQDEEYDKAYLTFIKVNYNDTAYFDSRSYAVESVSEQDKYDTVINICEEVLAVRKHNPLRERFMNYTGHALLQQDKNEKALAYLEKAIDEFPNSYILRYNKAVAYYELESYDEAIEELQMSIRYNPKYYASHIKLGLICSQAGDLTKAALCLNMGIFLIPEEEKSVNFIASLEAIYAGESDLDKINVKYREDEEFDEVDLMIKNKLAENGKYKVKVKLPYTFVKHNHLLFESINYNASSKGFWNQNYINFFKTVYNEKQFANFSYYQCLSIDNANTKKVIAKNKKKITLFISWAAVELTKALNERENWDGEKYATNILKHTGSYGYNEKVLIEDGVPKGDYTEFDDKGLIKTEGQFSNDGLIDGVWNYYEEGRLTTEATFVKGELEGTRTTFYENGSREVKYDVSDNKIDGYKYRYYSFNQLYSKLPFNEAGNIDGEAEYYHKNGEISYKMTYSEGELNGDYTEYYSGGELKTKYKYLNDEKEGDFISYYNNGKIKTEGKYDKGEPVGHWKYYHNNGKIEEEGDFKGGLRIGVWKTLSPKGIISEETNFGETGKKTGIYKDYDEDGKLILELTYKDVEIISYTTYNGEGDVVSQQEKKKKELEFIDYYSNGNTRIQGNYLKGKRTGTWKTFNQYGVLKTEENYNEKGELEGELKWYFDNGQIETIKKYKAGVIDGYFVDYFRNGNIYKHGWIIDGETVGEWQYFYSNGVLKTEKYYLEDALHGETKYYDEKGKLSEISQYYYGTFENVIIFDTLGNIASKFPLVDGKAVSKYVDFNGKPTSTKTYIGAKVNGESIGYHGNGKISSIGKKANSRSIGEWKWYDRDGNITTEGAYKFGERNGEWKWYYKNGDLSSVRSYENGNIEGVSYGYYENGKVETKRNYRNGERHGESIYYDESGEIQLIRFYDDGLMLGYSYLGKDGERVKMVAFDNQNGTIEAYYSSGVKSYYSEYKDGFNQGKTVYYHSNGKEDNVRMYEKDQRHGKQVQYYNNGKVRKESYYVNGNIEGTTKEFYRNGKLKSVKNYILDELYGLTEFFDEKGNSIEKIMYYNGLQMN